MADNRKALNIGSVIKMSDDINIEIVSEVGRGANCIVYGAVYNDSIGVKHNVRLKECYPAYLLLSRADDNSLSISVEKENEFEDIKEKFIQSYRKNVEIKQTLGLINSTVNPAEIIRKNNTVYILMTLDEGEDYAKYNDKSLKEVFMHIKSLALIIKKYHEQGYLHLDIKPENIFILPESAEHILLFDFDSLMVADELVNGGQNGLSFSKGFSAPEQIQGKIRKMGFHTDIYSIGAVLFYKMFGRTAEISDCRISSKYDYDKMQFASEKYQPAIYREITVFLKNTLSTATASRWQEITPVIEKLNELIRLSDINSVYLLDSFQYNSAYFVGREDEILDIDKILSDNQLVFLSGIGGIGKTEIAKQYAARYHGKYNTVTFAIYEKDIKTLVNDEINLNKVERDEKESEDDYFKRKIKILEKTATDDDLIIIDNFDVEFDEELENLFKCPAKFIITTRMDFRDYNYKQITIDRMSDIKDLRELFYSYNDTEYNEGETDYIEKLIEYVDRHTMTVELIAKYLKNICDEPKALYERFLEKEGVTNTEDIGIKQRKDRRLRFKSINSHIEILFDISDFNDNEKELISSLSLFAGMRILKEEYEKIYKSDSVKTDLERLIKGGWIEYNEESKKISLHQVIQDILYKNILPSAERCPVIVDGMIEYISRKAKSHSEKVIRRNMLKIFMERLTGENKKYAELCLEYGKEPQLEKALEICNKYDDENAADITQRIYRKKINNTLINSGMEFMENNSAKNKLCDIKSMLEQIIYYINKYNGEKNYAANDCSYMVKEYIDTASEIWHLLEENIHLPAMYDAGQSGWTDKIKEDDYTGRNNKIEKTDMAENNNVLGKIRELDEIYDLVVWMFEEAAEKMSQTDYDIAAKEIFYKKIFDFYSDSDFISVYKNKYYADMDKAYKYQKILTELRKNEDTDTSDMSITDENGTTKLWFDDITCTEYAKKLETDGKFAMAEKYYKKAYEDGEELLETAMDNIAEMYKKTGKYDKAIAAYKSVLDNDRKRLENKNCLIGYSCNICFKLINIFMKIGNEAEAEKYAMELILFEKNDAEKERDAYAINYVIAAYYKMYIIEKSTKRKNNFAEYIKYGDEKNITENIGRREKNSNTGMITRNRAESENIKETDDLWEECIKYYEMLGDSEIEPEVFDFIYEYAQKEAVSYEDIIKTIDRIDNWQNEEFKEKLVNCIIQKYKQDDSFVKYHIMLLVNLSETLTDYKDDDASVKKAMNYIEKAKDLYNAGGISDEYIRSIICKAEIKVRLSADIDIDCEEYEINNERIETLRKECNYMMIARYLLKHRKNSTEEELKIWQEAADDYKDAEKYDMEYICLENTYKIMNYMCDNGMMKKTDDNYMKLLEMIVRAWIKSHKQPERLVQKDSLKESNTSEKIYMDSYLAHIESNDSYNKIKSYAGKYLSSAMAGYENEKKSKAWRKINEIINAGDMFVLIKEELHAMEIYLEAGKRCIEQEKDAEDSRIKGKITDLLITIKNKMTEQKGIWENFAETKKEEKNKSEYKQKENLKRECDAFIREVSKEYEYKKIEFKNKK